MPREQAALRADAPGMREHPAQRVSIQWPLEPTVALVLHFEVM